MGSLSLNSNSNKDAVPLGHETTVIAMDVWSKPSIEKVSSKVSPAEINYHEIDGVRVLGLTKEEAEFYNSFTAPMRNKLRLKVREPSAGLSF